MTTAAKQSIGIVYFSAGGTTKSIAEFIGEGVHAKKLSAKIFEIKPEDIEQGRYRDESALEQLDNCEAIVFGSPVYMGSVTAQFKAFLDATSPRWSTQAWNLKYASAFVVGGYEDGDLHHALNYMKVFTQQHNMRWLSCDSRVANKLKVSGFIGLNEGGVSAFEGEARAFGSDLAQILKQASD